MDKTTEARILEAEKKIKDMKLKEWKSTTTKAIHRVIARDESLDHPTVHRFVETVTVDDID